MKNWLSSLIPIVCFLSAASAQLVFEQEEFVHDADLLEEKVEAVYKFRNVGDSTIKVTGLSATCGCTVPKLDKKTYEPGEEGEIRAVFTYGSRVGEQHKRITVLTEGAGKKTHVLDLIARIPTWVELQPRVLRWKLTDTPSSQPLLVEVPMHEQIKLSMPEDSQNFDIRIQQTNPGKFTFFITPKQLDKQVTEFIQIQATASDGDKSISRVFGVHCLIR